MSAQSVNEQWRLILDKPADGAWNMAVDESILMAVGRGDVPSTLRLYAWEPPCLSLGYAQTIDDVDLQKLTSLGWDIVRRPTGGSAILHTDELTYSIIGPYETSILKGSLLDSYRRIAQGLLTGLDTLGIKASIAPVDGTASHQTIESRQAICFEIPSRYEITVDHKKLIGSAQARRKEGILQHGTLPLYGDITRITKALVFADETERNLEAERIKKRATTVEEIVDCQISWQKAAQALISGFKKCLGINLVLADLSLVETKHAIDLLKKKYTSQQWTFRQV